MSSVGKRALFWSLTAILVAVVIEAFAYLVAAVLTGQLAGPATISREIERDGQDAPLADDPEDGTPAARQGMVLHPFFGYVTDRESTGVEHLPRFNPAAAEYGFARNEVPPLPALPDDQVVVAIFGGSFAEQMTVAWDALEKDLEAGRFSDREVVILGFGLGGYKQPQQLMVLNYFLSLGTRFDIVVNIDGFNEIALPVTENLPQEVFPFFPRGWNLRVDDLDSGRRALVGEIAYVEGRRQRLAAAAAKPPWSASMTAALILRARDRMLEKRLATLRLEVVERSGDHGSFAARGPSYEPPAEPELSRQLARVWAESSLLMHQICRQRGIEYYHFLQPNQYVPWSKRFSRNEKELVWRQDHPFRQRVEIGYPLLRQAGRQLEQQGVEFTDLTKIFAQEKRVRYRDTCCHLNQAGYLDIASQVAVTINTAEASTNSSTEETE